MLPAEKGDYDDNKKYFKNIGIVFCCVFFVFEYVAVCKCGRGSKCLETS